MKKNFSVIKKALCLILCAVFCIPAFTGCKKERTSNPDYALYGKDAEGKVMTNALMSEGMFSLFVSQQKQTYMMVLASNYGYGANDNLDDLWDIKASDGKTYNEHFNQEIIKDAKELVAANVMLYEKFIPQPELHQLLDAIVIANFSNTDANVNSFGDYLEFIDSVATQNAVTNYGSMINFEKYLEQFGATYEDYVRLETMKMNKDLIRAIIDFDEADKKQYYADNYYTVEHILINTTAKSKIDGTSAPITEEEKAQREAIANEILEKVKNGASLSQIESEYNFDYIIVYHTPAAMNSNGESAAAPELGNALKQLEVGQSASVATASELHIIRRIETDPEKYNSDPAILNQIKEILVDKAVNEYFDSYSGRVVVNDEVVARHPLNSSPAF